jgi:hypothetical protein
VKKQEIKNLVEELRALLHTRVTFVGNADKGRITIEYTSREDLYRLEEILKGGKL